MRRTALALVVLVTALGFAAAGCGGEENQAAAPETVEGEATVPTETTATETTATETTATQTTETTTTTTETTPVPPEGDPAAGKEIFLGASACANCHTLADAEASGTVGPNLDETKPSYELAYDRVTNGRGNMPSFSATLSEQQRADVAAYVSSVAGK